MEITNFRWADAEHKYLIADYNHEIFGWVPYTTFAEDTDETGRYIWEHKNEYEIAEYSDELSPQEEINELKELLANSDYKAIKYAEGQISEEDYAPVRLQRQSYRDRINELEALL